MLFNRSTTLVLLIMLYYKCQKLSFLSNLLQPTLYASESDCKLNRKKQPFPGVYKIGVRKYFALKMSTYKKTPELESLFDKVIKKDEK